LDGTSPALPGRGRDLEDGDPTQTLLVRMGRGATPDDARRDALAQLTLVYGTPLEAPPSPLIVQKAEPELTKDPGWLVRLAARFRRA
jgi:hypothetical protein